jgi:hypothetical protein
MTSGLGLGLGLPLSELREGPRSLRSRALWASPDLLLSRSKSLNFCTFCLLLQHPCANGLTQGPLPEEGVRQDCAFSPDVALRFSEPPIKTSSSVVLRAPDPMSASSDPPAIRKEDSVWKWPPSEPGLSTLVQFTEPLECPPCDRTSWYEEPPSVSFLQGRLDDHCVLVGIGPVLSQAPGSGSLFA